MLLPENTAHQTNLFGTDLLQQPDGRDPLLLLVSAIPWSEFEQAFAKHYTPDVGRPAKPIRLMVGLQLLKYIENLSDEKVVVQFKRNPYYQAFCGQTEFSLDLPCDSTELVYFRKRIGEEGFEKIFQVSVGLHGKAALEATVNIDTTVQEKNITYPTDAKLAIKIINRLNKLAKAYGIEQRRTFTKEVKNLRLAIRHFRHVKRRAKAKKALKRLRTIARILIRELRRKLPKHSLFEHHQKDFLFYERVLEQQPKDKNKIYSLHEPAVYCIGKGKDHKQYEYGNKVSIASTAKTNIIVGAVSHESNIHDNHTLPAVLSQIESSRGKEVKHAVCDRGYRGKKQFGNTEVILPAPPLKRDNRYQRDKKIKRCRRRAAIEPIIGHLKTDFRLTRNFLKGIAGDNINLLMAACAWNMAKWMRQAILFLFALVFFTAHDAYKRRTKKYSSLETAREIFWGFYGFWKSVPATFSGLTNYVQTIVNGEVSEFIQKHRVPQSLPVELEVRTVFNPNLDSVWFGSIMELVNSITSLSIILTGAALIREREHGTIEHLLVMPLTPFEIMMSKVWSMGLIVVTASITSIYLIVQGWLAVPIHGSIALFVASTVVFLFATTSIGIFLGTIARSMPQFGLLMLIILLPLQMLSGGTTPRESMPHFIQDIMQAAPTTHFVSLAQAILYRGADISIVWPQFLALFVIGSVFFTLALSRFRKTIGQMA